MDTSNQIANAPPPPPPPPLAPPPPPPPPPPSAAGGNRQLEKAKAKYKRVLWRKIPDNRLLNADTIWKASNSSPGQKRLSADFATLSDLFAHPDSKNVSSKSGCSEKKNRSASPSVQSDRRKQVTLLDAKQSMNTNIFLRQFKRPVNDLVKAIERCDTSLFDAEQLRTLLKLLPEKETFTKSLADNLSNDSVLDDADTFMSELMKIPTYQLRIECSMFECEAKPCLKDISSSLRILDSVITEIRQCASLPPLFQLVLETGNFLNQGASYGNASGFSLNSLKTLFDTKANQPGITLIHYVTMELERQDPRMLFWPNQIPSLSEATGISTEELINKLTHCQSDLKRLRSQVSELDCEDLKDRMEIFFKKTGEELEQQDKLCKEVKEKSSKLALYLGEVSEEFSLENCITVIADFREKFVKAQKENKEREKRKARRKGLIKPCHSHSESGENTLRKFTSAMRKGTTIGDDDELIIRENERDDVTTPLQLGEGFEHMSRRMRRRARVNRANSDPGFSKSMEEELFRNRPVSARFESPDATKTVAAAVEQARIDSFLHPQSGAERRRSRPINLEEEEDAANKRRNDDIRERIRRYKENSALEESRKRGDNTDRQSDEAGVTTGRVFRRTRRSRWSTIDVGKSWTAASSTLILEDMENDSVNSSRPTASDSKSSPTSNSLHQTSNTIATITTTPLPSTDRTHASSQLADKTQENTSGGETTHNKLPSEKLTFARDDPSKKSTTDSFSLKAEEALEDIHDVNTSDVKGAETEAKSVPKIVIDLHVDESSDALICDDLTVSKHEPIVPPSAASTATTIVDEGMENQQPKISDSVPSKASKSKDNKVIKTAKDSPVTSNEKKRFSGTVATRRKPISGMRAAVSDPNIFEKTLTIRKTVNAQTKPLKTSTDSEKVTTKSVRRAENVELRKHNENLRKPRPASAVPTSYMRSRGIQNEREKKQPPSSFSSRVKSRVSHAYSDPNIFATSTGTKSKDPPLRLYRTSSRQNVTNATTSKTPTLLGTNRTQVKDAKTSAPLRSQSAVLSNTKHSSKAVSGISGVRQPKSDDCSGIKTNKTQAKEATSKSSNIGLRGAATKSTPNMSRRAVLLSKSTSKIGDGVPRRRSGSQNSSASSENDGITSNRDITRTVRLREAHRLNVAKPKEDSFKRRSVSSAREIYRPWSAHSERVTHSKVISTSRGRTASQNSSSSSENAVVSTRKANKAPEKAQPVVRRTRLDKPQDESIKRRSISSNRDVSRPRSAHATYSSASKPPLQPSSKLSTTTSAEISTNDSENKQSTKSNTVQHDKLSPNKLKSGSETPNTIRRAVGKRAPNNNASSSVKVTVRHGSKVTLEITPKSSEKVVKWVKVGTSDKEKEIHISSPTGRPQSVGDGLQSSTPGHEPDTTDGKGVGIYSQPNTSPKTDSGNEPFQRGAVTRRTYHGPSQSLMAPLRKGARATPNEKNPVTFKTSSDRSHRNPKTSTPATSSRDINRNVVRSDSSELTKGMAGERNLSSISQEQKTVGFRRNVANPVSRLKRSESVRPSSPSSSAGTLNRSSSVRAATANFDRTSAKSTASRTPTKNAGPSPVVKQSSDNPKKGESPAGPNCGKTETTPTSGRSTPVTRTVMLRLQKLKKGS